MNAKMTITVPIEKVHLKIGEILNCCSRELEAAATNANLIAECIYKQADLLSQLEKIDNLRKELALLDANLDDCYGVLSGLVRYKTQGAEKKDAEQKPE